MSKNIGASIRQKLLNHAREKRVDFQQVLTRYGLERLLYRLSKSPEQRQFILKGAMLFELWLNVPHRPTRDLDFLAFGNPDTTIIAERFRRFLSLPVREDDGIDFDVSSIKATEVRKEAGYPGVRVTLKAKLDGATIPIQCDLGFGDAVTPGPLEAPYPTLLNLPSPQLLIYPQATVVAEKLEAMVKLDELNSRVKDYFDIWILFRQKGMQDIDIVRAIIATFTRRQTALPWALPTGLGPEFASARKWQWQQFVQRNRLSAPEFAEVVEELRGKCWPLMQQASRLKQ